MTLTTEQLRAEMIEKIAVASGLRARDGRNVVAEAIYAEVVAPLLDSREAQPVQVTDGMALDFHRALTDGNIGKAELEEIKVGLRAALCNVTTPPVLPVQHWEDLCRQNPNMSIGGAIIRAAWWNHCRAELLKSATPPAPAPAVPDDYFGELVKKARSEADKAMRKFPQPNYVLNKVAEESGEVIKAVIHYTEGREEWANVEGEIIDNLAMLIRLVVEGDQVIGFTPPDTCRAAMLAQPVSSGYTLPDNVREALTLALQAMEFMGDTLNNIDAVCTEDVEYVTPAFNAVRELLAAAPEGGNG